MHVLFLKQSNMGFLLKITLSNCVIRDKIIIGNKNKYAIYAYTHGPVTGSGLTHNL